MKLNDEIKKTIEFSNRLKILYVEDDKNVQLQTLRLLKNFFGNIDVHSNGEEGLKNYREFYQKNNAYHDIVISDIDMPIMNGFLMSEHIRKINPKQKIIIITAFSDNEILKQVIDLNVDKFIPKPIKDFQTFFSQLKTVIDNIQNENEVEKLKKEIEKKQKQETISSLLHNIAHQWRQPLSTISTAAIAMKMKKEMNILNDKEFFQTCEKIDEVSQFLSNVIDYFTEYIKEGVQPASFDIKNDVDTFIKLIDKTIKEYDINVILSLKEHIEVRGYPNELIQCFINLFNNAKDALILNNMNKHERYIFISQKIENEQVIIEFKDNAGGISDEIIDKVFEPYFTSRHQSQGKGLGLYMVYNSIVNSMRGTIEVENIKFTYNTKEYQGALFKITLPLSY